MLNQLLLPNYYRKVGFMLLPVAAFLLVAVFIYEYSIPFLEYGKGIKSSIYDMKNNDFSDELAVLLSFVALFTIAFSKEKTEDEYLQGVRLQALQISVYVNYIVLAVALVTVYGLDYLYVLYGNLFTILIIFIIVYYYKVHVKGRLSKEEQL